ncbi:diguanylate cyclase [Serratia sp. MF2]|uniref:sensor domain-containing diguanylate cyclase n=1 Tax=Serratia sp. MF2 TaxID=3059173 RepID=UPI0027F9A25E|nr:diguanylate cyclase [Serratia sp. MF2]MDQ7099502.1 diguanylate cyclase [Serratia sp. MF2]
MINIFDRIKNVFTNNSRNILDKFSIKNIKHSIFYSKNKCEMNKVDILKELPIPVVIIDKNGYLTSFNSLYERMCNLSVYKSNKKQIHVSSIDDKSWVYIKMDFESIGGGRKIDPHEFIFNGKTYLVHVNGVKNKRGVLICVLIAHIDITEQKNLEREIKSKNIKLKELNNRDHLTQLNNRRYFDDMLEKHTLLSYDGIIDFSLIFIDIDNFKSYNDTYGHVAGDECIINIALTLKYHASTLKGMAFRVGGEEIAIILISSLNDAGLLAEKIRQAVFSSNILNKNSPFKRVTISGGVYSSTQIDKNEGEMQIKIKEMADKALYKSKAKGRNKVSILRQSRRL